MINKEIGTNAVEWHLNTNGWLYKLCEKKIDK